MASASAEPEVVADYRFRRSDLRAAERLPGISAFMRIRNGAAFLERTIRSHIAHFDEIVAVHNRCTDETPDILARLAAEFGPKLRVIHYLPEVFPPGSEGHAREPADSPRSLVNYYNFALARTRHRFATKLDDDHLAIEPALAGLTARLRSGAWPDGTMACFSGLNLARDAAGKVGVLAREPFSGNGDIGFFAVSEETYFAHDQRFERFNRGGLKRRFAGFLYWHLKYLKPDLGYGNYDLASNPDSRYGRKLAALKANPHAVLTPDQLAAGAPRSSHWLRSLPLPEKARLAQERWLALRAGPPSLPAAAGFGVDEPAS
jgi:hypothetical protein